MSNKGKPNNNVNEAGAPSEGLSLANCPVGEQDWPGRHQTTADRIGRKQEEDGLKKRTE